MEDRERRVHKVMKRKRKGAPLNPEFGAIGNGGNNAQCKSDTCRAPFFYSHYACLGCLIKLVGIFVPYHELSSILYSSTPGQMLRRHSKASRMRGVETSKITNKSVEKNTKHAFGTKIPFPISCGSDAWALGQHFLYRSVPK